MSKTIGCKSLYLVMVIAIGLSFTGCGEKEEEVIVARIDDETITLKDIDDRIAKLPERYQDVIKGNKAKFLDELVIDRLLHKEAVSRGFHKDKDVQAIIKEAKRKILIAKLLNEAVDTAVRVDDAAAKEYYENNLQEFRTPEIRRASHIMVKTEEDAQSVMTELSNGGNFEELAGVRSLDPSSAKGGDIGYFVTGQLDPDFERVCIGMSEGQISNIVKTRFGYHVIKLTEIKPPTVEHLDDVKERIKHNLLVLKKKSEFNNLIARLKDRAKIEVYEDKLIPKQDVEKGEVNE